IGTRRHFASSGRGLGPRYPGLVVDSDVDESPAFTLATAIARAKTSDAVGAAALVGPPSTTSRIMCSRPFGVGHSCGWRITRFGSSAFPGSDRMDNLPKVHS